MEICEEGHDPIVWVRKMRRDQCPLCLALDELNKRRVEVKELSDKLEEIEFNEKA
jgi:SOS response regulatory protein OraA/RecX